MPITDLSGNNPLTHIGNQAKDNTAPAVRFDDAYNPSTADQTFSTSCRGFYIGVLGNLTVVGVDGNSTTFVGLVAGSILETQAIGTLASGTTSTNVIPLY